jgi:hypothetical protein
MTVTEFYNSIIFILSFYTYLAPNLLYFLDHTLGFTSPLEEYINEPFIFFTAQVFPYINFSSR